MPMIAITIIMDGWHDYIVHWQLHSGSTKQWILWFEQFTSLRITWMEYKSWLGKYYIKIYWYGLVMVHELPMPNSIAYHTGDLVATVLMWTVECVNKIDTGIHDLCTVRHHAKYNFALRHYFACKALFL